MVTSSINRGKTSKDRLYKPYTFSLTDEDRMKIYYLALHNNVSMSELIRIMVDEWFEATYPDNTLEETIAIMKKKFGEY